MEKISRLEELAEAKRRQEHAHGPSSIRINVVVTIGEDGERPKAKPVVSFTLVDKKLSQNVWESIVDLAVGIERTRQAVGDQEGMLRDFFISQLSKGS